jgi:hypothetical protein
MARIPIDDFVEKEIAHVYFAADSLKHNSLKLNSTSITSTTRSNRSRVVPCNGSALDIRVQRRSFLYDCRRSRLVLSSLT